MDDILDIEALAEVDVEVENEVDVEVEVEASGPQGRDGKSAYDIYLENGGELTETEWLESLKGGAAGIYTADISKSDFLATGKIDGSLFTRNGYYTILVYGEGENGIWYTGYTQTHGDSLFLINPVDSTIKKFQRGTDGYYNYNQPQTNTRMLSDEEINNLASKGYVENLLGNINAELASLTEVE